MGNNWVQEGRKLPVVCTHPAAPDAGDPVRAGEFCGVALLDEGDGGVPSSSYTMVDFDFGVYDVSVQAVNDSGDSAVGLFDRIYYTDADTPVLSKKASGYFFGFALETITSGETDTINVLKVPPPGAGTTPGDGTVSTAKLAANAVTAPKLTATMATGFVPLDITTVKLPSTNEIGNTSEGGLPDGNTTPILERVNGATDKALRITWAASDSGEIQFAPIPKPPDLDDSEDVTIHLMLAKDTNTDNTVTVDCQVFDGVGDTECGGATGALSAATLAEYSATVLAANVAAAPGFLNLALVPGAHTTDAIYLYAAWIEYTRK